MRIYSAAALLFFFMQVGPVCGGIKAQTKPIPKAVVDLLRQIPEAIGCITDPQCGGQEGTFEATTFTAEH